jgi:hypothetical protein
LCSADSRIKIIAVNLEVTIGRLMTLLINILDDNLIGNIAGTGRKTSTRPKAVDSKIVG